MTFRKCLILAVFANLLSPAFAMAQDEDEPPPQPAWAELSESERRDVLVFAEEYKDFMSRARSETSFVFEAVSVAREAGFRELTSSSDLSPGSRYYDINRDRTVTLIVVGSNRNHLRQSST